MLRETAEVMYRDAVRIQKLLEWETPPFSVICRRLQSAVFQEAGREAAEGKTPREALETEAHRLPPSLARVLCAYSDRMSEEDPAMQIKNAQMLQEELSVIAKEAKEKENRMRRVYMVGGWMAGAFLSLLFL